MAEVDDLNWLMAAGWIVELLPLRGGIIALTLTDDPADVTMRGTLAEVLAKARGYAERRRDGEPNPWPTQPLITKVT